MCIRDRYFNCPSCIFKNNSKQEFINHACESHPETIEHLKNIRDKSLADIVLPWSEVSVQIIKTEPMCESEIFQENIKESIEDPLNVALEESIKTENMFENISTDMLDNIVVKEELKGKLETSKVENFDSLYKSNIEENPKIVSVENENAEKIQPNQIVKSRSRKQKLEMREFNDDKIRYHHEIKLTNMTGKKKSVVLKKFEIPYFSMDFRPV